MLVMGVMFPIEFAVGSTDGVLPGPEGVAEPVGVETPLGPEVTDAAPLVA